MASKSLSRLTLFGRSRPKLQTLLDNLHQRSLEQERETDSSGKFFPRQNDDASFQDKLVALEEDKGSAMYLMLRAAGATRIFEAGTSYGVSTLYLLAALRDNMAQRKAIDDDSMRWSPCVYGTEQEPAKAKIAYEHMRRGFSENNEAEEIKEKEQLQILQGNLLQTIPKQNFKKSSLDALLLDIWAPVALPTLQLLEPALRPGAILFIDNTVTSRDRYKDLLNYIDDPTEGWQSQTLPFTGGFDVAVKMGK